MEQEKTVCFSQVAPYGITYFWLLGQVLCETQRKEHSRGYVSGVVTKHGCMDAVARATQERLPRVLEQAEIYDFIWLAIYGPVMAGGHMTGGLALLTTQSCQAISTSDRRSSLIVCTRK